MNDQQHDVRTYNKIQQHQQQLGWQTKQTLKQMDNNHMMWDMRQTAQEDKHRHEQQQQQEQCMDNNNNDNNPYQNIRNIQCNMNKNKETTMSNSNNNIWPAITPTQNKHRHDMQQEQYKDNNTDNNSYHNTAKNTMQQQM